MPFYDPNELSNYGQDITDLQDAQVNRLVDRAITQPAPQGTPSPVPGGGAPPGLAAALIQQLGQQQQAPQSLGEVLRRALMTAAETGKASFQSKAGINPNLNNPTTLRNALLQKAAMQQLIEERMLATQRQQQEAAQALEAIQNRNKIGLEGTKQTNRMTLNATPKALDPSISGHNYAETNAITQKLNPELEKLQADALQAQEHGRYFQKFNQLMGAAGMDTGAGTTSDVIPPDATPVARINPTTGAVTPEPGQTVDVKGLQGALQQRSKQPAPSRVLQIDTLTPSGGTLKYTDTPEEKARQAGLKATATAQAKTKEERRSLSDQANLAIQTIDELSQGINTQAGSFAAKAQGVGRETLSWLGGDPDITKYNAARNTLTPTVARGIENLKGRLPIMDQKWINESAFPTTTDPVGVRDWKVGLLRLMKRAADGEDVAGEVHSLFTQHSGDTGVAPTQQPQTQAPTPLKHSGGAYQYSPFTRKAFQERGIPLPGE